MRPGVRDLSTFQEEAQLTRHVARPVVREQPRAMPNTHPVKRGARRADRVGEPIGGGDQLEGGAFDRLGALQQRICAGFRGEVAFVVSE